MAVNKKRQTELKALGFLLQKDKEHFACRFLSRAGNYTAEELEAINTIAKKYGKGYSGITTRLQIEVPWIKDEDVENVMEEAKKLGLRHGGTGKKVRPLVACKGTVCLHGNIDTQEICRQLEDIYFGTDTPSKCKFGIVGCANNCAKASLNDIGVMGKTVPLYVEDKCVGCGLCVKACRQKALEVKDRKIIFNKDLCVDCGCCVRECRTGGFIEKERGAEIFVGGRFGRGMSIGDSLGKLYKEEEIIPVINKLMDHYRKVGISGERISKTINRIGKDEFLKEALK
ncbi:MAG: 4Fe-4S binding protein [Clostridium sp.]